jgi:hypothetical protein
MCKIQSSMSHDFFEIPAILGISCVSDCESSLLVLPAESYQGRDRQKGGEEPMS